MGSLAHWEKNLAKVGWFIPPYMQMGAIAEIAAKIELADGKFTQPELEGALARLYEPFGLAAMVLHRYPFVPFIQDYKITIREAVEANFLGLDHVAIGGLLPVIEGAGRLLAKQRGLTVKRTRDLLPSLADDCKKESVEKQIGATEEIVSMMNAFARFARDSFFVDSGQYPFGDGTNRNGTVHGKYSDAAYGAPINFYKTIAAVDFLTFIASFRARVSWLGPDTTPASINLAWYYERLKQIRAMRPPCDTP